MDLYTLWCDNSPLVVRLQFGRLIFGQCPFFLCKILNSMNLGMDNLDLLWRIKYIYFTKKFLLQMVESYEHRKYSKDDSQYQNCHY